MKGRGQAPEDKFGDLEKDLASPAALKKIFSKPRLKRALARIATRDKDDLMSHPLKAPILTEYQDDLADQLARLVPAGSWSPSPGYVSLTFKRSGAYRELVFPCLIDSVVGRAIIDVLEPAITADDDGKTFAGRSLLQQRA